MESYDVSALRKELQIGIETAKQGRYAGELYDRLSTMFRERSLDPSLHKDFGWFLYYHLRNTPLNSVLQRKRTLLLYFKLNLESPSLLHSMILSEAIKLKKSSPSQFRLRDFLRFWNPGNLRNEDWNRFKPKHGNSRKSLVENLIEVYTKEIKADNCVATVEFCQLVEKAITVYKTNPHLEHYRVLLLVSQGRKEEALDGCRALLKRWPKKFYLWSKAEELLPQYDIDMRIALLCKAITTARDEGILGEIRLRMANLLFQKGLHAHAKHELQQYEYYYHTQGWRINRWCETLKERLKIIAPQIASSPTPYESYLPMAEQFLNAE